MSFDDGWAAINMEMPRRIPRTEYSAEMHGICQGDQAGAGSSGEVKPYPRSSCAAEL
jgi:hypothetical protein